MREILRRLDSINYYATQVLADYKNGEYEELALHLMDLQILTEAALELCNTPKYKSLTGKETKDEQKTTREKI